MKKLKLNVDGMHCRSCGVLISDSLKELGATAAKVNHNKGIVKVAFDDSKIKQNDIIKSIEKEGYKVRQ